MPGVAGAEGANGREAGGEGREGKAQVGQGRVGHGEDLDFYPERDGSPVGLSAEEGQNLTGLFTGAPCWFWGGQAVQGKAQTDSCSQVPSGGCCGEDRPGKGDAGLEPVWRF